MSAENLIEVGHYIFWEGRERKVVEIDQRIGYRVFWLEDGVGLYRCRCAKCLPFFNMAQLPYKYDERNTHADA